ncbi:MAG: hypothetical protein ACK52P_23225 [Alphaproteobacteria bacterium]
MPQPDPEAEFDMALARAGVVVPPERRAAMMEGFRAWLEMRKLLNAPMPLATDPAVALTQPAGPRGPHTSPPSRKPRLALPPGRFHLSR